MMVRLSKDVVSMSAFLLALTSSSVSASSSCTYACRYTCAMMSQLSLVQQCFNSDCGCTQQDSSAFKLQDFDVCSVSCNKQGAYSHSECTERCSALSRFFTLQYNGHSTESAQNPVYTVTLNYGEGYQEEVDIEVARSLIGDDFAQETHA